MPVTPGNLKLMVCCVLFILHFLPLWHTFKGLYLICALFDSHNNHKGRLLLLQSPG